METKESKGRHRGRVGLLIPSLLLAHLIQEKNLDPVLVRKHKKSSQLLKQRSTDAGLIQMFSTFS